MKPEGRHQEEDHAEGHAQDLPGSCPRLRGDPKVVVTLGGSALRAVRLIEKHGLELKRHAGQLHDWCGRKLLPLYHPGLLGQITRPAAMQEKDIRALLPMLAC